MSLIKFTIDTEFYKEVLNEWNVEIQFFIAVEEMGELIQALSKYMRYGGEDKRMDVIKEAADVFIMTSQILVALDVTEDEVQTVLRKKKTRLREMLNTSKSNE